MLSVVSDTATNTGKCGEKRATDYDTVNRSDRLQNMV